MPRLFTIALFVGLAAFSQASLSEPGDSLEWIPWRGKIPHNAVRGGVDQNGTMPLYVCRAKYINGIHPGKLLNRRCHIGWGGDEIVLAVFDVLVSYESKRRRYSDRWRNDNGRR